MESNKKQYCSAQQKELLSNLMQDENNVPILNGKFSKDFTFKDSQKKWENIARELNALPGAAKDWKGWRKTWQDIKSKTKRKVAEINKHAKGTGGGPPLNLLSDTEEGILHTIYPHEIQGNVDIIETEINFNYPEDKSLVKTEISNSNISKEKIPQDNSIQQHDHEYATQSTSHKWTVASQRLSATAKEKIPQDNSIQQHDQEYATQSTSHKRTVASQRLSASTKAATCLVDINRQKFVLKEKYYNNKLVLLERQVIALEKIANSLS